MKRSTIGATLALSLALSLLPATWASAATAPFAYTGGEQTFIVPANVHTIHVVAVGAHGAGSPGALGGAGAVMGGDVAVSPGQILYIEVGGVGSARSAGNSPGGFNGGGSSGGGTAGDTYSGGGGSDVRSAPGASADSLASRLVVAGGGGGASVTAGGAAGSPGGGSGGGGAGTSSGGGAGGGGATASNGQFGVGGPGAVSASGKGGGGGGGGYFGGGGGAAGDGGGGGSSFSVSGGSFTLDTSGLPSVTITYTAVAPGGQSGGGGDGGPTASGLVFSHSTFAAEASGPSAYTVRRKAPLGTKVSFRLSEAAKVRFTVTRRAKGRKLKRGKKTVCVKPTKKNRKRKRCTRVVTLKGSFSRNGVASNNSFHFTGRLRGRKLKPGRYRLVATPTAGGKKGKPTSRGFRIVR